jgi:pantoate--beta-alanine ligase
MEISRRIDDLRVRLTTLRRSGGRVGFVPTMGALHEGHRGLLRRARADNDAVVMSLFVNPTQFTDLDDYEKYPRNPDADYAAAEAEGVDFIFEPDMAEMYPTGFDTVVVVRGLSDKLEGKSRPGHFQGVATVVTKLLNIVQADRAYFGVKDYQQLQVVRRMVVDLDIPTEIIAGETVREPDGLAMSSRNVRLTPEQRRAARVISQALSNAQEIADTGVHDAYQIRAYMHAALENEPLATMDYAVIVDPDELKEVDTIDAGAVALIAATFGKVRLIDNRALTPAPGYEVRR